METYEVVRLAVDEYAKQVRQCLSDLGKTVSDQFVYQQCKPSLHVLRRNFYETFWLWFQAIWRANRAGALNLVADLLTRIFALEHGTPMPPAMFRTLVREWERERSETWDELLKAENWDEVYRELLEDQAKIFLLLAWIRQNRLACPIDGTVLAVAA